MFLGRFVFRDFGLDHVVLSLGELGNLVPDRGVLWSLGNVVENDNELENEENESNSVEEVPHENEEKDCY